MPLDTNNYLTGRTPVSIGPNKDPAADLEAFVEQATISLVNGEVDSTFLVNVVSPWINVLSEPFSAPVDGTDCSSAVATAIAVAKAFTPAGAEVYFPRAQYIIDANQVVLDGNGVILRGAGRLNTVIRAKTGTALTSMIHVGVTDSSTTVTSGCGIIDMTIDGFSELATAAVTTWNAQDFLMRDVEIKSATGHGLLMQTNDDGVNTLTRRNHIQNCRVRSNGGDGVRCTGERYLSIDELYADNNAGVGLVIEGFAEDTAPPAYAGTSVVQLGRIVSASNSGGGYLFDRYAVLSAESLVSETNTGWGIELDSGNQTATSGESNDGYIANYECIGDSSGGINVREEADVQGMKWGRVHIHESAGTTFDQDTVGMFIRGALDWHMESLTVSGIRGTPVRITDGDPLGAGARQSDNITFGELILSGNGDGAAALNHGLSIEDSTANVTVGCAKLKNGQTATSFYEVNVSTTATGVRIESGSIESATAAFEFNVPAAALNEVYVSPSVRVGASWANPTVASAATLTIPPWGNEVEVTGTTGPITAMSPAWPGRQVVLRFTAGAGWPTLNDSVTAQLAGAAAFTSVSDDDTISLSCDGTTWRETSRSAN